MAGRSRGQLRLTDSPRDCQALGERHRLDIDYLLSGGIGFEGFSCR